MYIRIITFRLDGLTDDAFQHHTEELAPAFTEWRDLSAKFWLHDPATATYGGIYLFESAEAAEESRSTELFAATLANPAFIDLSIREFEVLDAPTAITAADFLEAAAAPHASTTHAGVEA